MLGNNKTPRGKFDALTENHRRKFLSVTRLDNQPAKLLLPKTGASRRLCELATKRGPRSDSAGPGDPAQRGSLGGNELLCGLWLNPAARQSESCHAQGSQMMHVSFSTVSD